MKIDFDFLYSIGEHKQIIEGKNYDLNFVCYLADLFLGEYKKIGCPEKIYSNFAQDDYRKRVMRCWQKEIREGRMTQEDLKILRLAHKKPTSKSLRSTAEKHAKYGFRSINKAQRGGQLNLNFWNLIFCLKEYFDSDWSLIAAVLASIRKDDGTALIKAEWSEDTLRAEWANRKGIYEHFNSSANLVKYLFGVYESYEKD